MSPLSGDDCAYLLRLVNLDSNVFRENEYGPAPAAGTGSCPHYALLLPTETGPVLMTAGTPCRPGCGRQLFQGAAFWTRLAAAGGSWSSALIALFGQPRPGDALTEQEQSVKIQTIKNLQSTVR